MKRVAVIGSGLAAISFILQLPEEIQVIWIAGEGPGLSNSYLAKGGIAVSHSIDDKYSHLTDTKLAGAFLGNDAIMKEVTFGSEEVFHWIEQQGIHFDKNPSREGGHSQNRIEHLSDQTGKFLVAHLWEKLRVERKVILLENHFALELLVQKGKSIGVKVGDAAHEKEMDIYASATVLATGGSGNLFERNTNAVGANGEGIGMAFEAGAELEQMEFVQFHPTRLYDPAGRRNILVTEAFRGAGAFLCNTKGEDFMKTIHPLGSLAPRDVVSLGMYHQMDKDNVPFLQLNFSAVKEEVFQRDFPYLYNEVKNEPYFKLGWIPVTPAAHYQCGGIKVNASSETQLTGLFAIGEVACTGLHGANRLASNSLLELFYFGSKLANYLPNTLQKSGELWRSEPKPLPTTFPQLSIYIKEVNGLMWHHFGILRTQEKMKLGLNRLKELKQDILSTPHMSIEKKRLLNRMTCAIQIAQSALLRIQSLGCHQCLDDGMDKPIHQ
jgi:L-aspartate oxidase